MNINDFIDELITELAYRLDSGIPDLKNKQHLSVLSEILTEWGMGELENSLITVLSEDETPVKSPDDDKYSHKAYGYYVRKGDEDNDDAQIYRKDGERYVSVNKDEYEEKAKEQGELGTKVTGVDTKSKTTTPTDIDGEPQVGSTLKDPLYQKQLEKEREIQKKLDAEKSGKKPKSTSDSPQNKPKQSQKQKEIRQKLNNGDLSELIKESDKLNALRDEGIAGMGGSVPSYGEARLTRAANEFTGDGFSNFKETNAEAIETEKQNIIANVKSNKRKISEISKQLGKVSDKDAIEYIAQRKVWGDLELKRLKSNPKSVWFNTGSKGFGEAEKPFRAWAEASFDGALATLHAVRTNSKIDDSKPFLTIQSDATKDGVDNAIYSHLADKLKEAQESGNTDDITHYETEIKASEKLGFNDTMVIGQDKNGRTTILHITNKKENDLRDMWANTTPEYMLRTILKQFDVAASKTVIKFAEDAIERCSDGKQATNRAFADMKIDENFAKLTETPEMQPYMDTLRQHKGFNRFAQSKSIDLENASTEELLLASQQYMESEKTVSYKVFGKVLTKIGEFAQLTKFQKKYPHINLNSDSIQLAVKNKNNEKDLVAAVHMDIVNEIGKADMENGFPDKDGNNGLHTEAYIATVLHSMHFDLMVENFDGNLAVVTGIRDSVPADFRGCLAELSGFKGDIESKEGRAQLNTHLLKQCKINATTGFIEITSPNGNVSLAEDSWRTAGESKKVEKKLGKDLSECVSSKVDVRKINN